MTSFPWVASPRQPSRRPASTPPSFGLAYLLDPGPALPDEQGRLFAALDDFQATGGSLAGVVLSHHHPDHVGAAAACATRYTLPVHAHRLTADKLHGQVGVDHFLEDGD